MKKNVRRSNMCSLMSSGVYCNRTASDVEEEEKFTGRSSDQVHVGSGHQALLRHTQLLHQTFSHLRTIKHTQIKMADKPSSWVKGRRHTVVLSV
ncbi:hypothetical protein INR49_019424 [Caranx melampygus]|nr:hypothetical protein INR49_019424 [Caranx melampygus]